MRPRPATTAAKGMSGVGNQSVDSTDGLMAAGGGSVRCVRGSTAQPDPHYTIQNGTVFDNGTKLTWRQSYDPITSLPNGVAKYCASLAGGGWRGPSVKELETIIDDVLYVPAVDPPIFSLPAENGNIDNHIFWSLPAPGTSEGIWVSFDDGSNGTGDSTIAVPGLGGPDNFFQVRCVK
jgi:hypothetical protein